MFRKCYFSFKVFSPEIQMKFSKITAVAKGFLTRRLLQTEKLKHLKQTVKVRSTFLIMWLLLLLSMFFLSFFLSCRQLTVEVMHFLLSEELSNICHLNTFRCCIAYWHKVQVKDNLHYTKSLWWFLGCEGLRLVLNLISPSPPGYYGVHKEFSVWSPIKKRKCFSTRCIPSWKSNGSGDII